MLTKTSTCSMAQPLPANIQEMNCARKHTVLFQVLASYCFIWSWFFQAIGEDFVLWPSPRMQMAPRSRNKLPMKRALEPRQRRGSHEDDAPEDLSGRTSVSTKH